MEEPITNKQLQSLHLAMSETIKELGEHVKDTARDVKEVLIQATKTNGRVNGIENALVSINEILRSQDAKVFSLEKTREKTNGMRIVIISIATPTIIVLGWLGKLYVDENNRTVREAIRKEIISEMDDKISQGIDDAFDSRFNKIKIER